MDLFKFYITHNAITTEASPLYDKLKFAWKKDDVRFRKECKTDFTFINNPKQLIYDFNNILAIENGALRCDIINFEIKISCDKGATYTSHWLGSFSINDGKFDLDKCTYKFTPQLIDKYSCLLKKFNKEYNLLLSGPLITIRNEAQSHLEFMYCQINYGDPYEDPFAVSGGPYVYPTNVGGVYFNSPICLPSYPALHSSDAAWFFIYTDMVDLGGVDNWHGTIVIYARLSISTLNTGGVSVPPATTLFGVWWEVPGSNNGTSTKFSHEWDNNQFNPNDFNLPPFIANYGVDLIDVNCGDQPPAGFEVKIINCVAGKDWYFIPYINSPTSFVDYTQFRTVYDAMLYLIQQNCPSITGLVSDFFEWNPIGDAPDYVAGFNYVTGLNNVVSKMAIAQRSDVIDPTATQAATIGMISLKNLLENFKTIFNVEWFIDENNKFRIEHIKYFTFIVGFNTTIPHNKKWNISNNKYSYKKDEMPSVESFKFLEAVNIDFLGKDITYDSACVISEGDNNSKQYLAEKITTDITFIELFSTSLSKTDLGFVLLVYVIDGINNVVSIETGKISGTLQNNGHLSFANLHYHYHRHGRVLLNGNMNDTNEVFFTEIKNKVQDNVKLQICCGETFDPTGILIQTELGNGEIETAEEENNIITLQINL